MAIKVTIFNEYLHEKHIAEAREVYPDGMHNTLKAFLSENPDFEVTAVTQDMPEHGLTDEVLNNTDVLLWWGHMHHHEVSNTIVRKVRERVIAGMGFIPMHSAHASKPFLSLIGSSGSLRWDEDQSEILWMVTPSHPIAKGIPEYIKLDVEEMYGEPFDIPTPDEIVFMGWFNKGCVFRSGCTFRRGHGKIFYFQPGHETSPTYHNKHIQQIIINAIYWAKTDIILPKPVSNNFNNDLKVND